MMKNEKKFGTKKGLNLINNIQFYGLIIGGTMSYIDTLFSNTFQEPIYLAVLIPLKKSLSIKNNYLSEVQSQKIETKV
ncbi:hypothetical protein PQO01_19545 [Lentisphaera marina]|uniref:hypothetical protein n=1 Tax=Lentisphaera marina TaxID=1111041 RepID=UPI00236738B3|nr:hypothetical protein [Lentisphaera marina]MDD7987151.1 hypothetical protein [Lentisphaera marina]